MEINNDKNKNNVYKNNVLNNQTLNDNNKAPFIKPYMGNLTSSQIGNMARVGALGGEMVKRMVQQQEEKLAEEYGNKNHPLS